MWRGHGVEEDRGAEVRGDVGGEVTGGRAVDRLGKGAGGEGGALGVHTTIGLQGKRTGKGGERGTEWSVSVRLAGSVWWAST